MDIDIDSALSLVTNYNLEKIIWSKDSNMLIWENDRYNLITIFKMSGLSHNILRNSMAY